MTNEESAKILLDYRDAYCNEGSKNYKALTNAVEALRNTREIAQLANEYHTCGRCRWGELNDESYPCNKCIHGVDRREDFWQYADAKSEVK